MSKNKEPSMEELNRENNSWVRRTCYSHTICHRINTSNLPAISFTKFEPKCNNFSSVSMPVNRATQKASYKQSISMPNNSNNVHNDDNTPKAVKVQRSVSPIPTTVMSDVFIEARASAEKRCATPPLRQRHDSRQRGSMVISRTLSPIRTSTNTKTKREKEPHWSKKYFDHAGSKVSALNLTTDFSVDMSKLYLGMRFASGANSRLYRGIYEDEEVAVKIIRQPDDDDDDDENGEKDRLEKQYCREVSCLSHLHHKNVIKLVAASKNPPIFCIITEYLSGGSLRSFLHKDGQDPIPLKKLISIALDIARGMEYIHSQGVIHRDLKPENILTDEGQNCVKIADFGISCEEAYCDVLAEDPGTYRWMAPEMIRHESYGKKVDVYSFGLLLWEMVSGRIPYQDMTPIQAAFAVVDKNLRPVVPQECPMALRALIEQCWALHPDKRPEFWQIVKVLEQFQVAMVETGNLDSVKNVTCKDHKKWIHKFIKKIKSSGSLASSGRTGIKL